MSYLTIIGDESVAISGGVIVDVRRSDSILKEHGAAGPEKVDASGKTVMRGFVYSHTHLIYSSLRESELEPKANGKRHVEILEEVGGILPSEEGMAGMEAPPHAMVSILRD